MHQIHGGELPMALNQPSCWRIFLRQLFAEAFVCLFSRNFPRVHSSVEIVLMATIGQDLNR
jgi:hypothetical protein